ncbi:protein adenylyltransferase SelO [Bacillus sp. FJAT-45066]|uniref:protein adenylyltransferase SelO n=1 Tax=Bacillus sp. FJAT-45066 TaxID=2011010 RepID=UPI000BB82532|nr:YdiU family protein [Bacillus sp. FJAT-45066]
MTNQIGWNFDNSYSRLPETFFSRVKPTPVQVPQMVIFNSPLVTSLGLQSEPLQSKQGVEILAGNALPEGAEPLAQAYGGHQFGYFNMLGDGRAILLGEQITPKGERYDIQLKGPGRTHYSRGGDGRAAIGPMIREYIISEAMYALGIPTTRSLAVVTTGEPVYRETELPGAILTRVASSHIRVGTFQYAAKFGGVENLEKLADYTIERHFPELRENKDRYLSLLRKVMHLQASLIAKWQCVGFIHGVMNTDNVTICGETIDYGPCAFMNTYNPDTVFSSIDTQGRYAYGNQPYIGAWNMARFAETLLPILHENVEEGVKIAQEEISQFTEIFKHYWLSGMRAKLGIMNEEENDEVLITELLSLMKKYEADFTNTFIALTFEKMDEIKMFQSEDFSNWRNKWQERLDRQGQSKESTHELMQNSNPSVIPRNHLVEEALEAASEQGDFSVMEKLLAELSKPYEHTTKKEKYCSIPPDADSSYQTFCGT